MNNLQVSLLQRLGYGTSGLKPSFRDETMKISRIATVSILSAVVIVPTQAGAGWGKHKQDKNYKSEILVYKSIAPYTRRTEILCSQIIS